MEITTAVRFAKTVTKVHDTLAAEGWLFGDDSRGIIRISSDGTVEADPYLTIIINAVPSWDIKDIMSENITDTLSGRTDLTVEKIHTGLVRVYLAD